MVYSSSRYLDKLASLRFFAAFLVVIYHMGRLAAPFDTTIAQGFDAISAYGFVGVSVFFILSGFVISHANATWRGWRSFVIGRITRIYPPHWIITLFLCGAGIWTLFQERGNSIDAWGPLLSNLALLQAWSSRHDYFASLNLVTWSLSVEVFFYAMFLLLRRLHDRHLYLLSIIGYLVILILTLHLRGRWTFWIYWLLYIDPLARLPEFMIGMALYRLYRAGALPKPWLPRFNFPLIFAAMLCTLCLVGAYSSMGSSFREPLTYVVIPAPFIILMMMALLDERSNAFMHNKALILLGESSFALYLIHKPIIGFVARNFGGWGEHAGMAMIILMLCILVLAIGGSVLFYRRLELPITRRLRSYLLSRFA